MGDICEERPGFIAESLINMTSFEKYGGIYHQLTKKSAEPWFRNCLRDIEDGRKVLLSEK